jgi:hypothetical protein
MIPAAIICGALFAGSLALSLVLGRMLAECDRREAEWEAIAEAERIVRAAYGSKSTWPFGGAL